MIIVSPAQIKAARAILDWSQEDLAHSTGLSITTIRQLELGAIAPRGTTTNVIRKTIEEAGIEFTDAEGVKRRLDDLKIYRGPDSCDMFYRDMLQTVSGGDGEVLAVAQSQEALAQSCGIGGRHNPERAAQLKAIANVKCLVWENIEPSGVMPFKLRLLPKCQIGPVEYFIYGDKHVLVYSRNAGDFQFAVLKCLNVAQSYRTHFHALWNVAPPLSN